MHLFVRLCLTITLLAVLVHTQGARGGGSSIRGGSSSSIRGGSTYRSSQGGSSCTGSGCNRSTVITLSVLGGIFGLIAMIAGSLYCYRRRRGRVSQPNTAFVTSAATHSSPAFTRACFESGLWATRYSQYNKWHGPDPISLAFDHTMSRVTGGGTDSVGTFYIEGVFSSETNRVALTKSYRAGTGDRLENFGHKVTIQLDWSAAHNQFAGKWYIQTGAYRGQGDFELKFQQVAEKPRY